MNIHHLELFYYVARHGGIVPAVRNIPYGIQQPAVSGQIARLEESLGTKLFSRRPFALLPPGKELFEFIRPFFDGLDRVGEAIRGGSAHQLRVAAPAIVLHDYLPEIFQRIRKHFPSFRLALHEAARIEAERLLQTGQIDVAIGVFERKKASTVPWHALIELPLILLVKNSQHLARGEELWGRDKIEEALITFRRDDPVSIQFQDGLRQFGVEWFPGIEVNSTRLIECYVGHGYGIGLSVSTPGFKPPKGIHAVKLPNFPAVTIGAAWTGKLSAIAQQFVEEVKREASSLRKASRSRRVAI
jgi:DNA-binding transcriptional LysR family regulator